MTDLESMGYAFIEFQQANVNTGHPCKSQANLTAGHGQSKLELIFITGPKNYLRRRPRGAGVASNRLPIHALTSP